MKLLFALLVNAAFSIPMQSETTSHDVKPKVRPDIAASDESNVVNEILPETSGPDAASSVNDEVLETSGSNEAKFGGDDVSELSGGPAANVGENYVDLSKAKLDHGTLGVVSDLAPGKYCFNRDGTVLPASEVEGDLEMLRPTANLKIYAETGGKTPFSVEAPETVEMNREEDTAVAQSQTGRFKLCPNCITNNVSKGCIGSTACAGLTCFVIGAMM